MLLKNFNPLFTRAYRISNPIKSIRGASYVKNLYSTLYTNLNSSTSSTKNFKHLRRLALKLNFIKRRNRKGVTFTPTHLSRRSKNLLRRKFRNYKFKVKSRRYNPNVKTTVSLTSSPIDYRANFSQNKPRSTTGGNPTPTNINLVSSSEDTFHHYTVYHYLQMLADPFFFKYKLRSDLNTNLDLRTFNKVLIP